MQAHKKFDVIIAGNGITGLSTALHLQNSGVTNVALCLTDSPRPGTHKSPGLITGGQIDNFTRFSHNYGNEIAAQLWKFGDRAYAHLLLYCNQNSIRTEPGSRLRLITSATELQEAEVAVSQLQSSGLTARLMSRRETAGGAAFTDRVLAVQTDGAGGAWVDAAGLSVHMGRAATAAKIGRLQRFENRDSLILVHTGEGIFECEMLVLACHLAIGDYLPELKDALVSVADQWSEYSCEQTTAAPDVANFVYTANHTYEWGFVGKNGHLTLGGGRYLRQHAGIEATVATFENSIEKHLTGQFRKTMSGLSGLKQLAGTAALDCRPCDELPIIGPMFGNSRILLATGYMGNGLALGFYAGQCLTELINRGTSDSCPRKLYPERLRSLES
jgi:glycine/D-amino acid oxidase-like deaminating enzyme